MYQPEHFKLEDLDALHGVIRANPLAQIVTHGPGGLMANAAPFVLHAEEGARGVLRSHLARPNAQWREIEAGAELLLIFQGGQGYVTPSWYASKKEHGKVVPTWNYVVVQVRGAARVVQDGAWLVEHVSRMSEQQETPLDTPWAVSDAPESFINALTRGIVGIEIVIGEITGKFKMSQNRPDADRAGVVEGFAAHGREDVAALVRALGDGRP